MGQADEYSTTGTAHRREILRGLISLPLIGGSAAALAAAPSADAALIALGRDFDAFLVRYQIAEAEDHPDGNQLFEEHWELREKIQAERATTLDGLKVKARAVTEAYALDTEADAHCRGSFIALSRSLAADLSAWS